MAKLDLHVYKDRYRPDLSSHMILLKMAIPNETNRYWLQAGNPKVESLFEKKIGSVSNIFH